MIYKNMLGEAFQRLHPKLQQRYELPLDKTFHAKGVMQQISAGPKWTKPMYYLFTHNRFLFPESGEEVPFTIENTCFINVKGIAEVYWERTFHFPTKTRQFNARMTVDLEKSIVKDYLGDPALFYSDLQFDVTKDGFLLIRSNEQRLVLGKNEFTLPKFLQGRLTVIEGYDDALNAYTIHVAIYNNIIGRMMHYAGTFKEAKH